MSGAFDPAAFDSAGFDTGDDSPGLSVWNTSPGYMSVAPIVMIDTVDVSARLVTHLSVRAQPNAARIATLALIPTSADDLGVFEGADITIDAHVFRSDGGEVKRVFTGKVERTHLAPDGRVLSIDCRDVYHEIIRNQTSAAGVEALFDGGVVAVPQIVQWNPDAPAPKAYFDALMETYLGSCALNSAGDWYAYPWEIGEPVVTYGGNDIRERSLTLTRPDRKALPANVKASLNFRYWRLHNVEGTLTFTGPTRTQQVVDGLSMVPKSMVLACIDGLGDWRVKGEIEITEPAAGAFTVNVGGNDVPIIITPEVAAAMCESLYVTLYRRWCQRVLRAYTVTVPVPGASGADDLVTVEMASEFDGDAWERESPSAPALQIWTANGPEADPELTGYEALPPPWPPANGAVDFIDDIGQPGLDAAIQHVVALTAQRVASALRQQQVTFSRPLDLRHELGDVIGIDAYGVTAVGQIEEMVHELDFEGFDARTTFTIACPDGDGEVTSYTATTVAPGNEVEHEIAFPELGLHIGASVSTPVWEAPDNLSGFLCNVTFGGNSYDDAAPVYNTQFRLAMPEISADVRDQIDLTDQIEATIEIAGSGISVIF